MFAHYTSRIILYMYVVFSEIFFLFCFEAESSVVSLAGLELLELCLPASFFWVPGLIFTLLPCVCPFHYHWTSHQDNKYGLLLFNILIKILKRISYQPFWSFSFLLPLPAPLHPSSLPLPVSHWGCVGLRTWCPKSCGWPLTADSSDGGLMLGPS